ncbi:MAG: hypothetical protein ACOYUK_00150 [Patescibacteria group bacterium]
MNINKTDTYSFATPVLIQNIGQNMYGKRQTRTLTILLMMKRLLSLPSYGKNRRYI